MFSLSLYHGGKEKNSPLPEITDTSEKWDNGGVNFLTKNIDKGEVKQREEI
jgi:hypothetical protein